MFGILQQLAKLMPKQRIVDRIHKYEKMGRYAHIETIPPDKEKDKKKNGNYTGLRYWDSPLIIWQIY